MPSTTKRSLLFIGLMLSTAQADAQQLGLPNDLKPPAVVTDHTDPAVQAAQSAISRALQDRSPVEAKPSTPPSSRDPLLDDVMEVIRNRGSVIDGSSLDPHLADESLMPRSTPHPPSRRADQGNVDRPSTYLAVENLLRTARLLESMPNNSAHSGLVHEMRAHASKILIDAISAESAPDQHDDSTTHESRPPESGFDENAH